MPLQKSFSDQNHSATKRQQWQRQKTYPGAQRREEPKHINNVSDKPPIPVSSNTKKKLSAFQFDGTTETTGIVNDILKDKEIAIEDKENIAVNDVRKSPKACQGLSERRPNQLSSQRDEVGKKRSPTTPAGRMALLDLMGVSDTESPAIPQSTPEERVMWDHRVDTIPRLGSSSTASKNGAKKRTRSSSPTASPTQALERRIAANKAVVENALNSVLKTPQIDPASELWGRYVYSTDTTSTRGPQHSVLANLVQTSSPQLTQFGSGIKKKSPFSKSASCGTQWPRVKRQKLDDTRRSGAADDVFATSNVIPNPLRIRGFLEGVKDHFNSSRPETPQASSSSPAPERTVIKQEEGSPSRLSTAERLPTEQDNAVDLSPHNGSNHSSSSNYGEFNDTDFDESFMEAIECPVVPDSNTTAAPSNQITTSAEVSFDDNNKVAVVSMDTPEDETFDDFDDDAFAADLEDMVAKYDTQKEPQAKQPEQSSNANQQKTESLIPGVESEDEYGDDFGDVDFDIVEATATQNVQQSLSSLPPPSQKIRAIQRYLVTSVLEGQYENSRGRLCFEKVLIVQVENAKLMKTIHLRDGWFDTPATAKAYVHVIGDFNSGGQCVIDDLQNMIILHPDHLVSSTVVADSFSCIRRAVLQDRVKATSESTPPLVYGTILHEIFQSAMMVNRWDTEFLDHTIDTLAARHIEDLYTIKIPIVQAVGYLKSKMGELQAWAELFVSSKPNPEAIVKAGNGETATMCVTKLLDVEEHVWSPMYGLKGNIDATVQVTMQDGASQRTLTVPFEVKTGKNANAAHRAQTALYNLLLSDRYDIEIAYGILYYMETSEIIRIPAIRHELRHMIMQRNELACFVRERDAQLPPMLKRENLCNRCYAKVPCFIYHRLADDGTAETSGMKTKFDEVVKHLTPVHIDFFLKWDDLLTKEEKESLKFRRELWTMLSSEREKLGRCFSNVIIEPGSAYEEQSNQKINRFRYTMVKQNPAPGFSFMDSQITIGEPIVISDEQGHFALANGFVTNVRKQRVTVAVDRRLHNARIRKTGFDEENNQTFASIMEVAEEGSTPDATAGKIVEPPVVYRLDKDEFSNGMATVRNNLIQTMADGPFGSREIRNLVVDLVAPQFKSHSTAYTLRDRRSINIDQRRAIEKVMSAQDYALVLGMPGTGKTTTIAHIIRALVSQGKSVLLTSYTHTAVDNILLKLRDDNIPILRIGAVGKVNDEVQQFATLSAKPKATFEELRSSWHDTPVVATTCLGINHPLFNERTFDYCIVDEASQITLPVCLGPIRMARTFILVGDHNQLPPLVQNEEAREGGLDVSLFKLLSDKHPSSVVNLEHQYRMCEDVMALSNALIYNGRLKCGTPEVANRSIVIPNMDALKSHHYTSSNLSKSQKTICAGPFPGQCWLRDLLDPATKVRFLNTDTLLPISREEAKGNRIVNPTEANICTQLVESLLTAGIPASSIGVMTHYRSQLALLKHHLRARKDVEMHTADRFQGRDKEVVILSLVRSNEAKSIGDLLKDWRRINVAFTRAKTKLLVVGSRSTLKGPPGCEEMVAKFVSLMEGKGWVFDLPSTALEGHMFEDLAGGTTQGTARSEVVDVGGVNGTQWVRVDVGVSKKSANVEVEVEEGGKKDVKLASGAASGPKKGRMSEKVLFEGRPVLRDIMNDARG